MPNISNSPLGNKSIYKATYDSALLFPIERAQKRSELAINNRNLPFYGLDCWNAYEISFLNLQGKPVVLVGRFLFPSNSPNIIESKSFKLYLNSLNNTKFSSIRELEEILIDDLSKVAGSTVSVNLYHVDDINSPVAKVAKAAGKCLDDLDVVCDVYEVNSELLALESSDIVSESLYSNLLKSNCLVTGQPDWATITISYTGKKFKHASLLQYLVSFRNHNEFHEQCVERIYMDISKYLEPSELQVCAYYTRRGGLDISPVRSSSSNFYHQNTRVVRQ